jgi:hypothetical protein
MTFDMIFFIGLHHVQGAKDAIRVVEDRLMNVAHLSSSCATETASVLAPLPVREVVRLCGLPKTFTYNRDTNFVPKFWESLPLLEFS